MGSFGGICRIFFIFFSQWSTKTPQTYKRKKTQIRSEKNTKHTQAGKRIGTQAHKTRREKNYK